MSLIENGFPGSSKPRRTMYRPLPRGPTARFAGDHSHANAASDRVINSRADTTAARVQLAGGQRCHLRSAGRAEIGHFDVQPLVAKKPFSNATNTPASALIIRSPTFTFSCACTTDEESRQRPSQARISDGRIDSCLHAATYNMGGLVVAFITPAGFRRKVRCQFVQPIQLTD